MKIKPLYIFTVFGGAQMISDTLRRRASFVLTSLGALEKGFYTPYNYLVSADWAVPAYPDVTAVVAQERAQMARFLTAINGCEQPFLDIQNDPSGPDWNSRFLSPLDAAALYTWVVEHKPKRIIEVGSGNTTHFMTRAIADHALETEISCIDPCPRVEIADLDVNFTRRALSLEDLPALTSLGADDILFIDSSHILQQGFDVDIILNRALPALQPGVVVHFHDIFLPYGYPAAWKAFRFNEQMALIPWLLSGILKVGFASHYVWRDMKTELQAICPQCPLDTPANGGSLWLRKTA